MSAINSNLRKFRKNLDLNQSDMADIIEVSVSNYRRYENGELSIPSDKLEILIEKYDLNLNWLFTGTGEMFLKNKKGVISEKTVDYTADDDKLYEVVDELLTLLKNRRK